MVMRDESVTISHIWNTNINSYPSTAIQAGNYIAFIDTNSDVVLVDVLTGKPFKPVLQNMSNPTKLTYNDGYLVVMDYDNNDHNRFKGYKISDLLTPAPQPKHKHHHSSGGGHRHFDVVDPAATTGGSEDLNPGQTSSPTLHKWESTPLNLSQFGGTLAHIIDMGVYEGALTILFHVGSKYYVLALDIATGKPAWQDESLLSPIAILNESNAAPTSIGDFITVGDGAFFMVVDNHLYAYNRKYGDVRFPSSTMVDAPHKVSLLGGRKLFYSSEMVLGVNSSNAIQAVHTQYGNAKWTYQPKDSQDWQIACVSKEGNHVTVYTNSGLIQVLDVKTGDPIWVNPLQITGVTTIDKEHNKIHAVLTPITLQVMVEGYDNFFVFDTDNPKLTKPTPSPFETGSSKMSPMIIDGSIISCEEANGGGGYNIFAHPVGQLEDAVWFNGSTSPTYANNIAINSMPTIDFGSSNYSAEFWMRSMLGGTVLETTPTTGNVMRVNVSKVGRITLMISQGAGSNMVYNAYISEETIAADGTWHHIAAVVETDTVHIYVDAVKVETNQYQTVLNEAGQLQEYYNGDNEIVKTTVNNVTKTVLKQLPPNTHPPKSLALGKQNGITISPPGNNVQYPYSGLLREVRIWESALSPELIQSRMFKILGPNGTISGTNQPATKTGKEPKMWVNLHLDKQCGVLPSTPLSDIGNTITISNNIGITGNTTGNFVNARSIPTNLVLEQDGFPYLIDKAQKQWPFEEHWAVRGEHQITTNPAISNGILCFGANNSLYGVRKHDGKHMWSINVDNGCSNPVATDMGFLVLENGHVVIIDPISGIPNKLAEDAVSFSTEATFDSNHYVGAMGEYIVYASEKNGSPNGVSYFKNLTYVGQVDSTADNNLNTSHKRPAKNIHLFGSTVYWYEETTSGDYIIGYDLDTNLQVAKVEVISHHYTMNDQYLYCIQSGGLSIIELSTGNVVGSPNSSITKVTGLAVNPSNTYLAVTQNYVPAIGASTSAVEGLLWSLKPATLTVNWKREMGDVNVNPPVIVDRNVFCCYGKEVEAFDLSNQDSRGSFTLENTILSPPLIDRTTAYMACANNTNPEGVIDGALHQVVFGETNVLKLLGNAALEIQSTGNTTHYYQTEELDPTNCCVETWVNLESTSTAAGLVSMQSSNGTQMANMHLYLDENQQVHFKATNLKGSNHKCVEAISVTSHLVKAGQWSHVAVNVRNKNGKIKASLYINGKPYGMTTTMPAATGTIGAAGYTAYLGATGASVGTPANELNGLLGYVRIWDTYLNVSQIMDRMHTQLIGTEANLLSDWSFNQLSIVDATNRLTPANCFTTNLTSGDSATYILNELNFTQPNYPFLTSAKGERYSSETYGDLRFQEYSLEIQAHKADGSPLTDTELTVWLGDGDADWTVYGSNTKFVGTPSGGTSMPLKPISEQNTQTGEYGIQVKTDSVTGIATVYVAVGVNASSPHPTKGPGLDVWSIFLPDHERFQVNALMDRQGLKIAPPPTISAQTELVSDFHYETGGQIHQNRRKSVYRAIIRTENAGKTPLIGEMVTLYADSSQTIMVEGKSYQINEKNGATFYTDGLGELMIDSDATELSGFMLEVWAGFMHRNDRIKFAMAEKSHERLSQVNDVVPPKKSAADTVSPTGTKGKSVLQQYYVGWSHDNGTYTNDPILNKKYKSSSTKIVTSFHHLMAAASSKKKSSEGNPDVMSDLANVETVTQGTVLPVSKPWMKQLKGSPQPDRVSPIRTLSYINRKKTMDFDGMKDAVQMAAVLAGVSDAQGLKLSMKDGDTSSYALTYLNAAGVAKAKTPSWVTELEDVAEDVIHAIEKEFTHGPGIKMPGGNENGAANAIVPNANLSHDDMMWDPFSDIFHAVESLAEKAAHAFEDLVHEAETLVLDFTNDVEADITGILDHFGPLGHMLADGIEKVMAVVHKIIKFIDVMINTMLEFLTLMYEWEHIVNTESWIIDHIMTPFLNDINAEFNAGTFIDTMLDKMTGSVQLAPTGLNIPNHSLGSIKNSQSGGVGAAAHGVKSKSLFHKTKSNASKARHKTISGSSKPIPSTLGTNATSLTQSLESDLKNFNFSGSINPLEAIISGANGSLTSDIVSDLKPPLKTVLNKDLFDPVYDLLTAHIDIPFVSALYHFLTGHTLKVSNLFSLIAAVPTVLIYEVATNGNFIDDSLKKATSFKLPISGSNQTQTQTQTQSPSHSLLKDFHLGKLEDDVKHLFGDTTPSEPSYEYVIDMAILYCSFTEVGIMLTATTDYLNYYIMTDQEDEEDGDTVNLLHVGNALFGIGAAASYWAVNKDIGIALKIDKDNQAHPGLLLTGYINNWNTVNDVMLGFSIVASIGKAVWNIGEYEFPKLGGEIDTVSKGFYAVIGTLVFGGIVALYAGRVVALGDTSTFQKALQERMELNLTGTLCKSISMLMAIPKSMFKKSGNKYGYIAICGVDLVANEAAVGCKTAGEVTFASSALSH
jgi:hypothetical protein